MIEARALAKAGAAHLDVVRADEQTGGRGRRGRTWQSQLGRGLYFTVILRLDVPQKNIGLLPLAIGVSLYKTLRQFSVPITLKWPNDVVTTDGRKLAGILLEHDAAATVFLAGVGINLKSQISAQASERSDVQGVAALDEFFEPVQNNDSGINATDLLNQILPSINHWTAILLENPQMLLQTWRESNCVLGQQVRILQESRPEQTGLAEDIGDDGALLVRVGQELHSVHAADVSLRLTMPQG